MAIRARRSALHRNGLLQSAQPHLTSDGSIGGLQRSAADVTYSKEYGLTYLPYVVIEITILVLSDLASDLIRYLLHWPVY